MPTAPRAHHLMLRLPFLVYKEAVADRTDIAEGLLQVRFSPGIAQPLHEDRLAGLALLRLHACWDGWPRPSHSRVPQDSLLLVRRPCKEGRPSHRSHRPTPRALHPASSGQPRRNTWTTRAEAARARAPALAALGPLAVQVSAEALALAAGGVPQQPARAASCP